MCGGDGVEEWEIHNYSQGLYPLSATEMPTMKTIVQMARNELWQNLSLSLFPLPMSLYFAHYLCFWSVWNAFKIDYTSECLRVDIILDMSLSWC